MRSKILILMLCLLAATSAIAAEHSGDSGKYSFTAPNGWTHADGLSMVLDSPDGALLTEMELPDAAQSEPAETVREKVTYFHQMAFGGEPGAPKLVSGSGWKGMLQQQTNGLGLQEYQLVAKSSGKTYAFYLTAPRGASASTVEGLESVILSLKVK